MGVSMTLGRKGFFMVAAVCVSSFVMNTTVYSESVKSEKKDTVATVAHEKKLKPQTTCPIMGGAINKKQYVDYKDKRIYVCCGGCVAEVKKDPEAAIKKLADMGQEPEVIPAVKSQGATNTKTPAKDTSMKEMKMSGSDMKGMDMSGMDMSKDSSMKGMDHRKMK
jgi:hypothetical protein